MQWRSLPCLPKKIGVQESFWFESNACSISSKFVWQGILIVQRQPGMVKTLPEFRPAWYEWAKLRQLSESIEIDLHVHASIEIHVSLYDVHFRVFGVEKVGVFGEHETVTPSFFVCLGIWTVSIVNSVRNGLVPRIHIPHTLYWR